MAFGDEYIERIRKIWTLTEPPLQQYTREKGLYEHFRTQYQKARELSAENARYFHETLLPFLASEEPLTDDQVEQVNGFCNKLIELEDQELIDRMLCIKLRDRLLKDAKQKNDRERILKCLYQLVQLDYHMTELLKRAKNDSARRVVDEYYKDGREHIHDAAYYLPPERFRELSLSEVSHTLLPYRLEFLFCQGSPDDPSVVHRKMQLALGALRTMRDPQRIALFPTYNWKLEADACLYYVVICGEFLNRDSKADPEDLRVLREAAAEQLRQTREGESNFMTVEEAQQQFDHLRYVLGEIDADEYLASNLENYGMRDPARYDSDGITANMLVPGMILNVLGPLIGTDAKYAERAEQLYRNVMQYALAMPNNSCQEIFLNYALQIMDDFREVPERTTFAEFCDTMMANCSPSTYVHSQMVGRIAQMIGDSMVDRHPERFIGLCGCADVQQVKLRRRRILHLLYECGIYHDIGKLPYLDTIGVTYRNLFPEEMRIVRLHPMAGFQMLDKWPSTRKYAHVAFGHHRWYDESAGYPEEFHRSDAPFPLLIDIIAIADCLDAATDTIFRSYNPGITIERFVQEAHEGAGTRYSPDVVEVLDDPDVCDRLEALLVEGREEAYLCAYKLYRRQIGRSGMAVRASGEQEAPAEEPQESIDAAFERLFTSLEESDEDCERFRMLVLAHLSNQKVRDVYIGRFEELVKRKDYPVGRAIACAMDFWRDFSEHLPEATRHNDEGIRLMRRTDDYRYSQAYLCLLNNAVLAHVIGKDYVQAYRVAMEGIQILREKMVNVTFYYALLNNTSMILTDIGLLGKARKQLEESLRGIDMLPVQSVAATRYRYAELLMTQGEYDAAQTMYLEMLGAAQRDGFIAPAQIYARLTVLSYRRRDGVAIRYWHEEMHNARACYSEQDRAVDYDSALYADAVYYAWTGQYRQADEAFQELLSCLEHTMFDRTAILRDAAELYDSFGKTERSHPLYIKLDEIHLHSMQLVDEVTSVENEMTQREASREAYGRLFERMKDTSALVQKLAACINEEEIIELLTNELPSILPMDAFLLMTEQEKNRLALLPRSTDIPEYVASDDPRLPAGGRLGAKPVVLTMREAQCALIPASLAVRDGTLMRLPLRYRGSLLGELLVYCAQPAAFNPDSVELAGSIGSGMSIALMNISRYEGAVLKANMDPLTGVANRSGFLAEVERRTHNNHERFGLYMLDIDDFKQINDAYGHDVGDRVLLQLADTLTHLRGDMIVGRYGGEEFVMLAALHKKDTIASIGRKICAKVASMRFFDEQSKPVTVSVGTCLWKEDGDFAAQIKSADEQMYLAKHNGKNRVCALK